ncbi:MAG TPA: GNAT family N-acetyltransferase [Candidatus Dormibacteraeota bacterium]
MTQRGGRLRFEPITEVDLPLLATWRARPHVAEWFHGSLTPEQTAAKFIPRIRGDDPVRGYIAYVDDVAVGYIQSFRVADHPDVVTALQIPGDPYGVDVLLGDADARGHGLGTRLVSEFTQQLLAAEHVDYVVISPDTENAGAIRAYEKAGFVALKTVPSTKDARTNLLMEYPPGAVHARSAR